jgi:hypothetical protein
MGSGSSPCASCKLLRRRCTQECIFAPYFPSDDPRKFAIVHKVFGASNISKMLQVSFLYLFITLLFFLISINFLCKKLLNVKLSVACYISTYHKLVKVIYAKITYEDTIFIS